MNRLVPSVQIGRPKIRPSQPIGPLFEEAKTALEQALRDGHVLAEAPASP